MKISTTKQLSAYLKDVRLDNELSQADVAKKVGVRQDTVSNFELRAGTTKMDTFFKLLSALELDFEITPRNGKNSDDGSGWKEEW
ncbi:helix-turn-helix domain-containing protein [Psychromonas sp. Urea-02u-13]|jgi:HTH-type transcriptional regulator / antitoxin HipB|uniref:helix-turn-helix domain-containing protein n=1 Tax=Psychromonas sp. Urea-02u-13 TaxID=2058326 RepID=UPI000C3264E6|nr:helix-turn-helix domain-containing protein [Psychromonas sp. Urea-02u-13]PKG40447.1 transcriptional regulator [Psychromonas sp. Urea-02u-13]